MRLIDADALMDALPTVEEDKRISLVGAVADFLMLIDDAPTVDATPVVHARWEIGRHWCYECSVCKKGYVGMPKTNYCPNCGAKMDGEGKDND